MFLFAWRNLFMIDMTHAMMLCSLGNMLGRVSQSLSRLSAQSLPPEPNQDPNWQSNQRSSSLMQQREDVDASQGAQQQPRSEQQGGGQQQQRSWWPFRRGMQ